MKIHYHLLCIHTATIELKYHTNSYITFPHLFSAKEKKLDRERICRVVMAGFTVGKSYPMKLLQFPAQCVGYKTAWQLMS